MKHLQSPSSHQKRFSDHSTRSRHKTEGRFVRAIRLASRYGTYRQQLEAKYEDLWTAYWWFDDVERVNTNYDAFEAEALKADHARNLESLVQLHQLLINSVVHGLLAREEARLDERSDRLEAALLAMTKDPNRPNHRLEARTSLAIVRLGRILSSGERQRLGEVWDEFGALLTKAVGLSEYDASRLVSMIEVSGAIAGRDRRYRDVAERLAEFVSKRSSEIEGALILKRQALQLDDEDRFERIRLLGRAAAKLAKKEYADELAEAQQHLALAYRSADLLWAARAACLFAASALLIRGEEESELPAVFVPTVKIWAWISLQLRLVPELLYAVQLLNGSVSALPLTEDSKAHLEDGLRELDMAFASNILNMDDAEVACMTRLPDVLGALGMFTSRTALLYTLTGTTECVRNTLSGANDRYCVASSFLVPSPTAPLRAGVQVRGHLSPNGTALPASGLSSTSTTGIALDGQGSHTRLTGRRHRL